jgi:hypothetical protein
MLGEEQLALGVQLACFLKAAFLKEIGAQLLNVDKVSCICLPEFLSHQLQKLRSDSYCTLKVALVRVHQCELTQDPNCQSEICLRKFSSLAFC